MEYEDALEKIISIVSGIFGVPKESLSEDSTWAEDLQMDLGRSLQDNKFVDLKATLDREFGTDIPNMKFGRTKNLKEATLFMLDLIDD